MHNSRLFDVSHDSSTVLSLDLGQGCLQGLGEVLEVCRVCLEQMAFHLVWSRRRVVFRYFFGNWRVPIIYSNGRIDVYQEQDRYFFSLPQLTFSSRSSFNIHVHTQELLSSKYCTGWTHCDA